MHILDQRPADAVRWDTVYDSQTDLPWFSETCQAGKPALIGLLKDAENLGPHSSGLYLGCGDGRNLERMSDEGFDNVVGVDVSRVAIEQGKAQDRKVMQANALKLAHYFPDNSFDFSIDIGMYHEILRQHRPRLAKQLKRVLRPGGYALIAAFSTRDYYAGQAGVKGWYRCRLGTYVNFSSVEEISGSLGSHFYLEDQRETSWPTSIEGAMHHAHLLRYRYQ